MIGSRRIGAGLVALGLTFAPVVITATRAYAQFTDAEGADGGDVAGGDGGIGSSGVLPTGSQNNAAPDGSECFSDELCALSSDTGGGALAGSGIDPGSDDPFETDAFAEDA